MMFRGQLPVAVLCFAALTATFASSRPARGEWREKQPRKSESSALALGGELENHLEETFSECPLLKKLGNASLINEDIFKWSLPAIVAPAPPPRKLLEEWVLEVPPTRLVVGMGSVYTTALEGKVLETLSTRNAIQTIYSSRDAIFDLDARFQHEESCATLASLCLNQGAKFGVDEKIQVQCQNKTTASLSLSVGTLQNQFLADIDAAEQDWERGRRAYEELWRLHGMSQAQAQMYVIDDVQAVFLVSHRLATATFRSDLSASGSWNIGVVGVDASATAQIKTGSKTSSDVGRAYVFAAKTAEKKNIPAPERFRVKPLPSRSLAAAALRTHMESVLNSDTPEAEVPVFEWDANATYQVMDLQLQYKANRSDPHLHLGRPLCEQAWQAQVLTAESVPSTQGVTASVHSAKMTGSDNCRLTVHVTALPSEWKDGPARQLRLRVFASAAPELQVESPFGVLVRAQHVPAVGGPTCHVDGATWACSASAHILRHDQKPINYAATSVVPPATSDVECVTNAADGQVVKSSPSISIEPSLASVGGTVVFKIASASNAPPPWERCTLKNWAVRVFPKDRQQGDSLVHMLPMNFDKPR